MNMPSRFLGCALVSAFSLIAAHFTKADIVGLAKVGICDHPENYADQSIACDEIIASGIKNVRFGPNWGWLSSSKGTYNATRLAQCDDIVNRLSAAGVNVLFVLNYTALWATSVPGDMFAKPANWSDWEDYVSFITARYNNKVTYWEVWNEPDYAFWHGTPAEYVTLLQKASAKIRAANPNNKVLMGGLAGVSTGTGTFFDTILGLGAASSFDIINYHSYDISSVWRTHYNGMKAVIDKYGLGSRKIWITETGFSTSGTASLEKAKSDYIDDTYHTLFAMDPNIEKVFAYVHRNTATGNVREDNFGLLANSRTPLPAFYHFQATNGAETNFKMQKSFPSTEYRRTLNFVPASNVVDYVADGAIKKCLAGTYMYFTINDAWMYNNIPEDQSIIVDVVILDVGTEPWALQYDSTSSSYAEIVANRTNTGGYVTKRFVLNDAKFANNQPNAADFRICPLGASDLIVNSVAVRRNKAMGWNALAPTGTTDQGWLMQRIDATAGSGYNPVASMGGKSCRQILDNNHFIYFDVARGLVQPTDARVAFTVTFWDAGTDNILISYNAIGNAYKSSYITKTNTNAWKTYQVFVTDANFLDLVSGIADFRIGNASDGSVEYVRSVKITRY